MTAGRPRTHDDQLEDVLILLSKGWTVRAVEKETGVSRSTVHRMGKQFRLIEEETGDE